MLFRSQRQPSTPVGASEPLLGRPQIDVLDTLILYEKVRDVVSYLEFNVNGHAPRCDSAEACLRDPERL